MAADRGRVLKAVAMVVTGRACKTKCCAVYQPRATCLKILDEKSLEASTSLTCRGELARDLLIFKSFITPRCRSAILSIAAVTAT